MGADSTNVSVVNSLFVGASRTMDLYGALVNYRREHKIYKRSFQVGSLRTDAKALSKNWQNVGGDVIKAMDLALISVDDEQRKMLKDSLLNALKNKEHQLSDDTRQINDLLATTAQHCISVLIINISRDLYHFDIAQKQEIVSHLSTEKKGRVYRGLVRTKSLGSRRGKKKNKQVSW